MTTGEWCNLIASGVLAVLVAFVGWRLYRFEKLFGQRNRRR